MKADEINSLLRSLFKHLIDSGFTRHSICSVTLGNQSGSQFSKILNGTDVGIKPLSRIFDSLGYDLHIVPIRKGDNHNIKPVNDLTIAFIKDSYNVIFDYLKNNPLPIKTGAESGTISDIIQEDVENIKKTLLEE